jgi:amino acid adenylation domain-containing protein
VSVAGEQPELQARHAGDAEAEALLHALARIDVRLTVREGRLHVSAPKGSLDGSQKAALAAHRDALIRILGARESAARGAGPLHRRRGQGALRASSAQRRLWFLDRMSPGRPEYNIGIGVRIKGALDPGLLRRSLDMLVARHESLRMRFVEGADGPLVEVLPAAPASCEVLDLVDRPAQSRVPEMNALLGRFLRAGFDLAAGRLARFALVRLAPTEHVLVVVMHHAVSDGWSLGVALKEIFRAYGALAEGREPALPELPMQFPDYADWEHSRLEGGHTARQLEYWKRQLAGAPPLLDLPLDRPRPRMQSFRGMHVRRRFDTALLEQLRSVSRREDVTLFMTLLGAWQMLMGRYSGQQDVVLGSPVANRGVPALEGMIGCLVNNVVLRGDLSGSPTVAEYLQRVKRATLDAFDNGEVPFDTLVEALNPERNLSHAPVFQVLFGFQSAPGGTAPPEGLELQVLEADWAEVGTHSSRFDLTVDLIELDGSLEVGYEYATDLFDEATIARMHGHFEALLRAIVADTARRIDDLPLLGRDEERQVLEIWNDTSLEHDRGRCIHRLLEAAARAHPEAPAVTDASATLTYAQLEAAANRLAHLLLERGIGRGALVGVCLERTVDMVVALAGVLKAGAAYLPLDPAHPAERLAYVLQDAGAACVVTLDGFRGELAGSGAPLLALDALRSELMRQLATNPDVASAPSDLAYVIYTSGSTGRPKGVEVEHRNVVSFLDAMRREPGLGPQDVVLATTTLSFDIAGLEIWLPLSVGARVVVASRMDALDGRRLAQLLETYGVTMLQATPPTWRLLLDCGWSGRRELKALCGGEALPADLASALSGRVGELWNLYGPTETTIWSTAHRVGDPSRGIPIGRPIANTRAYVLEPSGHPAPIGVPGELCIAGEGVARGYRGRPELTAERFVTITLPNGRTERVYRTGDIARLRADGELEYVGRRDSQVKVRGHRIELGEIEAVLAQHEPVKECVVAVREDSPGDQRLVAYVVTGAGTQLDVEAAREALRRRLPEYMVPGLFMTLESLPLTPNGKMDRRALPRPRAAEAREPASEVLMTPLQRRVAAIWCDVLGVERVGLHENFFDLGGHSLLLVRLQTRLQREFGRELALIELFQSTTVSAQAARLSGGEASDALSRAQERAAKLARG